MTRPPPQEVYVLLYRHRHGTDVGVYHDRNAAEDGVWDLLTENEDEFARKATKPQMAKLDKARTKNLGLAFEVWSDVLEDESFEICQRYVETGVVRRVE